MKLIVLLPLFYASLCVAAPDLSIDNAIRDAKPEANPQFPNWRCLPSQRPCFRDRDCCSGHCVNARIWPLRYLSTCQTKTTSRTTTTTRPITTTTSRAATTTIRPVTTTTRPSSILSPRPTTSCPAPFTTQTVVEQTYTYYSDYRDATRTTHYRTETRTGTTVVTPPCSTFTHPTFTTVTRPSGSKDPIITRTISSPIETLTSYPGTLTPPIIVSPVSPPPTMASPSGSPTTTSPCTPSYGYFTETYTGVSVSRSRSVTYTQTFTYTAIYDPPCAFGYPG